MIAEGHGDTLAFAHRGAIYYHDNRFPEAIADLTRALRDDPDNRDYLFYRGQSNAILKQYAPAFADFDHIVRQHPDDTVALYWRGLSGYQLPGRQEQSLADVQTAHARDPSLKAP
jgi:tetratricopeptide (TPR) repeat protein